MIKKWDWTQSLQREVLDELKENPLVKFSSSLSGLIGIMDEMTKSTKFDNVTLNNGAVHKIYQGLVN